MFKNVKAFNYYLLNALFNNGWFYANKPLSRVTSITNYTQLSEKFTLVEYANIMKNIVLACSDIEFAEFSKRMTEAFGIMGQAMICAYENRHKVCTPYVYPDLLGTRVILRAYKRLLKRYLVDINLAEDCISKFDLRSAELFDLRSEIEIYNKNIDFIRNERKKQKYAHFINRESNQVTWLETPWSDMITKTKQIYIQGSRLNMEKILKRLIIEYDKKDIWYELELNTITQKSVICIYMEMKNWSLSPSIEIKIEGDYEALRCASSDSLPYGKRWELKNIDEVLEELQYIC